MLSLKNSEKWFLVLILVFSFFIYKNQLINLFRVSFGESGYYYSRQFDLDMRWINTDNLANIRAIAREEKNKIIYKFSKDTEDRVLLKFLLGKPYDSVDDNYKSLNFITISSGNNFRKNFDYHNLKIGDNTINLTKEFKGRADFDIYIENTEEAKNKFKELSVRRIEVSVLPGREALLPNLAQIAALIIISILFFHAFVARFKKINKSYICLIFLGALLIIAIHLRWSEVERLAFAIPHPDASHPADGLGYREIAENMKLFTKNGFFSARGNQCHEPFYAFVVKIFFTIFGSSDLHLRFVSFIFSVGAVFLTYLVAREVFISKIVALLSAALVAFNGYLIEQSALGLRLELEMCFLLLLFYFSCLKIGKLKNIIWLSVSGVIAGLWLLTKAYNLPVIIFIFAYAVFSLQKTNLTKKIILFASVSILACSFLIPYKINQYKTSRNLLNDSGLYTTTFANTEFAGQPGFPRSYVSMPDYFFKLHTPWQLLENSLSGVFSLFYFLSEQIFNVINEQNHLIKILINEKLNALIRYPFLASKISLTMFLTLISIFLCLKKPKLQIIIYIIIIGNSANLFFYGVSATKGIVVLQTQRTIAHVMPFMAFGISYSLVSLYHKLITKILRRERDDNGTNSRNQV